MVKLYAFQCRHNFLPDNYIHLQFAQELVCLSFTRLRVLWIRGSLLLVHRSVSLPIRATGEKGLTELSTSKSVNLQTLGRRTKIFIFRRG